MDISLGAAVSAAAPSPDASCASAEVPASASDIFAALLDEAAGTSRQSTSAVKADEDAVDEQAVWTMPNLSFMDAFVPVAPKPRGGEGGPSVSDTPAGEDSLTRAGTRGTAVATGEIVKDAIAAAGLPVQAADTIGEYIATAAAEGGAATEEATMVEGVAAAEAIMADARTARAPAQDATASIDVAPTPGAATSSAGSPTGEARGRREIVDDKQPHAAPANDAAPASKVDDAAPASNAARASRPSRGEHTKPEHKAGVALAAALAGAQATTAAAPIADAAQASARTALVADVQNPGGTAARFARAVERAAALTVTEPSEGAAATSAAPAGQSGEQSPPFGESVPDQTAERFGSVRQAAIGGMTFTITAPTSIDARTIATAMAGATHAADAAPGSIPERDVVAQLVHSMRLQFRDGIGEAIVKLKPEHLGSVQVSLRIENGAVRATVQAEMPAVRQWLESQQETLKNSLADQGLRLERFVVEPDGERREAQRDAERQRQQRRRHHRREGSADQPVFEVLA
ncbi:MAG TPA: flagellar hook-length control protein FliK [Vicinamibacterales bacterium]|nr:flagellar hook-length control protein FliK [Vicinamibacterales bacterium]